MCVFGQISDCSHNCGKHENQLLLKHSGETPGWREKCYVICRQKISGHQDKISTKVTHNLKTILTPVLFSISRPHITAKCSRG